MLTALALQLNKFIDQKVNYTHNNCVEAGNWLSPEDYLYSGSINYAQQAEEVVGCDIDSGSAF